MLNRGCIPRNTDQLNVVNRTGIRLQDLAPPVEKDVDEKYLGSNVGRHRPSVSTPD